MTRLASGTSAEAPVLKSSPTTSAAESPAKLHARCSGIRRAASARAFTSHSARARAAATFAGFCRSIARISRRCLLAVSCASSLDSLEEAADATTCGAVCTCKGATGRAGGPLKRARQPVFFRGRLPPCPLALCHGRSSQ